MELGLVSHLNQEVTKVEEVQEGDWLVTFRETTTSPYTDITTVKDEGDMTVVHTQRVALAIPAAALKRIEFVQQGGDITAEDLEIAVKKLVQEVMPIPFIKLFTSWSTHLWNKVNHRVRFCCVFDSDPFACSTICGTR